MNPEPRQDVSGISAGNLGLSLGLGAVWIQAFFAPNLAGEGRPATSEADSEFFRGEVLPLLDRHCFKCHGREAKLKGGLRLSSRAGVLRGGDSGSAVDLEAPGQGLLLAMIGYRDADHEMPPDGKLAQGEMAILTEWVLRGVPFDPDFRLTVQTQKPNSPFDNEINDHTRNYWAFRPIEDPIPPEICDADWAENPIDRFVYAKLGEKGLRPNPPAPRAELIRRAYYDLIGLPPSPEEVVRFKEDRAPDAFARVVDRLLASPRYGEKWGRHWLDLVRYAETNGYERDNTKPDAWRYRDYVIQSFNRDKPYDQFVEEQLAGDELDAVTTETLIATGYQRLGIWDDEPVDADQAYFDGLDDVLVTTGQVFLGLTIGCARCHDHKIDPIPQEDYYRMLAFFSNTYNNIRQLRYKKAAYTLNTTVVIATGPEKRAFKLRRQAHETRLKSVAKQVERYETRIAATFTNVEKEDARDGPTRRGLLQDKAEKVLSKDELDDYLGLQREWRRLKRTKLAGLPSALVIKENGPRAPDTFVLQRGNVHAPGKKVRPGFPQVLGFPDPPLPVRGKRANSSGRRRVLAEWIVNPKNPLTARVMANRVWQFHFGRGLVRSPSNFGQNGDRPTHPKLLDWLARDLMNHGWRLKHLHRRIMLSKVYQMSSRVQEAGLEKDPTNDGFWRFDMRRLTAEEFRDSILQLSDRLNLRLGGPSVYPEMPPEVLATSSRPDHAWGTSPVEDQMRRSVYIFVKRSLNEPMLKAFDLPDTDSSCAVRFSTTVPTQSLTMLNSAFVNQSAEAFARRLKREVGRDTRRAVERGMALVTSRRPSVAEIDEGVDLIEGLEKDLNLDWDTALDRFCLMALNLNEFLYLD